MKIFIVFLLILGMFFVMGEATRAIVTRNVTGVKLAAGNMEIIDEMTCSDSLVRLTCRSFKAFVFVLEAEYLPNRTDACVLPKWKLRELKGRRRHRNYRDSNSKPKLRGNYIQDDTKKLFDLRVSVNRRCSGLHHCRYKMAADHQEVIFWKPANIRIKYACIPEVAVFKYCNANMKVSGGEGGYMKSPGYPLYYAGGITCGWTFRSLPGQRIVLTFHDLSIRGQEADGSCVDVVRIRDSGTTLYESCGSAAGVKIISNTNVITLNLIASARFYPARGFLLQYQVLGCPDIPAPNGSYISNGTLESRTFLCQSGTLFPDTKQRTKTVHCKDGRWDGKIQILPGCASNESQPKSEGDRLSPLSGDTILEHEAGIRTEVTHAAAGTTVFAMDPTGKPAAIKESDYILDLVLPSTLIAVLFIGNAIIVYIIFQYRKRKQPPIIHPPGESMALGNSSTSPQV